VGKVGASAGAGNAPIPIPPPSCGCVRMLLACSSRGLARPAQQSHAPLLLLLLLLLLAKLLLLLLLLLLLASVSALLKGCPPLASRLLAGGMPDRRTTGLPRPLGLCRLEVSQRMQQAKGGTIQHGTPCPCPCPTGARAHGRPVPARTAPAQARAPREAPWYTRLRDCRLRVRGDMDSPWP